jgi:DNA-binding NtrC family response regulator/tetratricopeptide (TPR) repeat protein
VWLETDVEITNVALALVRSDADAGLRHGTRALQLAEQSGKAGARRAALANLGNLLSASGRFDEAIDYFHRAVEALPSLGDNWSAALDSIARVRIVQGRLEESSRLLDRIAESIRVPSDRRRYAYRNAQLTRTQLLARQERWDEALSSADTVIQLAKEAGDHLLTQIALLTKAELLQQTGHTLEAMTLLEGLVDSLAQHAPDVFAHYERILACALGADDPVEATLHHDRARRLAQSIHSAPGLIELERRWNETAGQWAETATTDTRPRVTRDTPDPSPATAARDTLQSVAVLLRHHSRPELIARELVHLLETTNCVAGARAVSKRPGDDALHVLATTTGTDGTSDSITRRVSVGSVRNHAVELELDVRPGVGPRATVNAVRLLLTTIQDLERARIEREERISLWPADDDPEETGHAVVNGYMRDLMSYARRIANTNVSVFITGESGTGKEILARAIHRFSGRADKPFIPFNCTAVPRDMLESQLFGYRRGSFTGADRDHPGMIGAARDGTLFLDEIGELRLDLQPKLLRFLESGEVCPIGESTPFTVNVRVLAATNSNVEDLVKEGRFREDLFYRLNVFRLRVPPLRERRDEIPGLVRYFVAQSAVEFKKGDVRMSEEAMEHLLLCRWPGNVRQLQNEIRRMVALAEPNTVLTPGALSEDVFNTRLAPRAAQHEFEMAVWLKGKLLPTIAGIEREMIRLALRDHQGSLDAAARALGISRKGLYLKRQRLGL